MGMWRSTEVYMFENGFGTTWGADWRPFSTDARGSLKSGLGFNGGGGGNVNGYLVILSCVSTGFPVVSSGTIWSLISFWIREP